MEIDLNLYTVASSMIKSLLESSTLQGVDSIDRDPNAVVITQVAGDSSKSSEFAMSTAVYDGPVPKGAPTRRPIGEIRYEVTVRATFVPFDKDD